MASASKRIHEEVNARVDRLLNDPAKNRALLDLLDQAAKEESEFEAAYAEWHERRRTYFEEEAAKSDSLRDEENHPPDMVWQRHSRNVPPDAAEQLPEYLRAFWDERSERVRIGAWAPFEFDEEKEPNCALPLPPQGKRKYAASQIAYALAVLYDADDGFNRRIVDREHPLRSGWNWFDAYVDQCAAAVGDEHAAAMVPLVEQLEAAIGESALLRPKEIPSAPPEVGAKPGQELRQSRKTRSELHARWLAEAMLLVRDHPDWSDAEIASRVGKSPSTLSRSPEYQRAAGYARGSKSDRQKGHISIDPETGQQGIEAYSDDPAEQDWDN